MSHLRCLISVNMLIVPLLMLIGQACFEHPVIAFFYCVCITFFEGALHWTKLRVSSNFMTVSMFTNWNSIVAFRPDAAALFHLLEKAPPLRPDISITTNLVQDSKPVIEEISPESLLGESASLNFSSSEIESSKTTADAFTELGEYKKMKELLLKQCKGTQA